MGRGVLFGVAMVLGLAGPLLAFTGVVAADPTAVQVGGLMVALAGFAVTLAAQTGMGTSWRIGVDPAERTDLVTTGALFGAVRNPVFSAMVAAQLGVVLMVPTWVSVLALAALVAAVQIQVRCVEEPYLQSAHGAAYTEYASRTGRFVPGLGRLPAGTGVTSRPA